jgi:hypothetical protein
MKLPESIIGRSWTTPEGELTGQCVQRVFDAIEAGQERCTAIPGARVNSDRRVDRATQVLRKAGLIEFAGGKWRVVVPREAQT